MIMMAIVKILVDCVNCPHWGMIINPLIGVYIPKIDVHDGMHDQTPYTSIYFALTVAHVYIYTYIVYIYTHILYLYIYIHIVYILYILYTYTYIVLCIYIHTSIYMICIYICVWHAYIWHTCYNVWPTYIYIILCKWPVSNICIYTYIYMIILYIPCVY